MAIPLGILASPIIPRCRTDDRVSSSVTRRALAQQTDHKTRWSVPRDILVPMRAIWILVCAVAAFAQPADLVLRNGKIVTVNGAAPTAQAIAVRGDKIAGLGTNADAPKWIGANTKVIDLKGQLAIPGFIEGHGHFTGIGEYRQGLDLREARTWDDIVAQVARAAKQAKPGEWIVGRGWHQSKWDHAPEPNVEAFRCTSRSTRCRRTTRF